MLLAEEEENPSALAVEDQEARSEAGPLLAEAFSDSRSFLLRSFSFSLSSFFPGVGGGGFPLSMAPLLGKIRRFLESVRGEL